MERCLGQTGNPVFTSINYSNEYSTGEAVSNMSGVVQEINTADFLTEISSPSAKIMPRGSTMLGTMVYYQGIVNYKINVSVDTTYFSDSRHEIVGFQGTVIQLIAMLISATKIVSDISTGFVSSLMTAGIINVIGDKLAAPYTTTLRAQVNDETLRGISTSDTSKRGTLYGQYAFITDEGARHGEEYNYGYTHNHWRTGYLGSAMFWEVYGVNYTPTSWIDAG